MGNTGMFLLEDPGLQSYVVPSFEPLGWNMAGTSQPSTRSLPTTPNIPSPIIPVSQVTAAPYPVVSTPFMSGGLHAPNYPTSSFSHASQQNIPQQHQQNQQRLSTPQQQFTAINSANMPLQRQQNTNQDQPPFYPPRSRPSTSSSLNRRRSHGVRVNEDTGAGPRGIHHRLDRPPRSQTQRRK